MISLALGLVSLKRDNYALHQTICVEINVKTNA